MKRDWLPPAIALALACATLPATGWLAVAPLPATLSALARIAAWVLCLMLLAAALRGPRGLGIGRPLTVLLAAVPCFVLVVLSGTPGLAATVPWRGLAVLLVVCLVTATAERELSRRITVGVLGSFLLLALFAPTIGLGPLIPARWHPLAKVQAPLPPEIPRQRSGGGGYGFIPPASARQPNVPVTGRKYTATRWEHRVSLGLGPGPWYVAATSQPPVYTFPLTLHLGPDGGTRFVHRIEHPLDLDPEDTIIVGPDALKALPKAERRAVARCVAGFIRAGGLLIGPAPEVPWPPDLGLALGEAGKSTRTGYEGRRLLGLGTVVRAADKNEVDGLIGMDLWVPPVQTVFRRVGMPPPPPDGFPRWQDQPGQRRAAGALLLASAALLLLLVWIVRSPSGALGTTLLWAVAVSAGLYLIAPREPGFVVQGAVLELGGPGGRRTEVVWLAAGPGGFRGHVQWRQAGWTRTGKGRVARPEPGGFVRLIGGELDVEGRVVVEPGQGAWILRETVALAPEPGGKAPSGAFDLRALLRGKIDPKQVSRGWIEQLPVSIEGSGPVSAPILRVHRP